MNLNLAPDPSVTRLPVQIRPLPREGTESFIVRLAHANHLKAAYLRDYLCEPPHHKGAPSFSRLGAATGRDPSALRDTLEGTRGTCGECDAPLPATKPGARSPRQHCSARCRQRAHRRRHRTDQAPHPQPLACEFCARPIASTAQGEARRWCSSRCRHRAHLQLPDEPAVAVLVPVLSEPRPTAGCQHCGTPIDPGRTGARRYCSAACRQRAFRRRKNVRNNVPARDSLISS
nr:TniQ family protein [Streptomyces sp. NBC_00857]